VFAAVHADRWTHSALCVSAAGTIELLHEACPAPYPAASPRPAEASPQPARRCRPLQPWSFRGLLFAPALQPAVLAKAGVLHLLPAVFAAVHADRWTHSALCVSAAGTIELLHEACPAPYPAASPRPAAASLQRVRVLPSSPAQTRDPAKQLSPALGESSPPRPPSRCPMRTVRTPSMKCHGQIAAAARERGHIAGMPHASAAISPRLRPAPPDWSASCWTHQRMPQPARPCSQQWPPSHVLPPRLPAAASV